MDTQSITAQIDGLTIALCTRNRITELRRCLASICVAQNQTTFTFLELLIVDDGLITHDQLDEFARLFNKSRFRFVYFNKSIEPGLFKSRIAAINHASGEVILFLDDDVEISRDYITLLGGGYLKFQNVAGIGGVDILLNTTRGRQFIKRLFMIDSGNPSKLSFSGYNHSQESWVEQNNPFISEYLSGCNMSYKKAAVAKCIVYLPWLNGYSLGEDLALSHFARQRGNLWVDPQLHVLHHHTPKSRDNPLEVALSSITNHYQLLKLYRSPLMRYIALGWTIFGLVTTSLIKMSSRKLKVYLRYIISYLCRR